MTRTLKIDGMSCGHCVKAVTMTLQDLPGVEVKDVAVGRAVIEADEQVITIDRISRAIEFDQRDQALGMAALCR